MMQMFVQRLIYLLNLEAQALHPKSGELTKFNMNTETTVSTPVEKKRDFFRENSLEYTTSTKNRCFNILPSVSGATQDTPIPLHGSVNSQLRTCLK